VLTSATQFGALKPHLALFGASFIWGLSYLGTKIALEDMGPFQMATVRVAIAAAFYIPAFVNSRGVLTARQGMALGLLGVVLYYVGFNIGLQTARVTDAGVIQASIPAVAALIAIPMLRERPGALVWVGIALSFLGVVVLVSGTGAAGEGSLVGDLFILWSVLIWALYSVYVRKLGGTAPPATITAATLVWGAALLIPLAVGEVAFTVPRVTPAALAATVFLAVFAGALAYWLWSYGLARVHAARATNYLNLLPLVAVISGTLVLGERIGAIEVAGGLLIVGGVTVAARSAD
jgi:drug/metabolite transporter (DMT)-like permease